MVVPFPHAMHAENACMISELRANGGQKTSIAKGAEILGRIETERGKVSQSANRHAVPRSSEGLRGIFDQQEVRLPFQRRKRIPVRALTVKMDRKNRLDLCTLVAANHLCHGGGGQVEGGRVNVRQHGLRPTAQNRAYCRKEAER